MIDKYEVITFDIFDTLLKRNVLSPHDIFLYEQRILIQKYGKKFENFKENRIQAEYRAREKDETSECSLQEIYSELFANCSKKQYFIAKCIELEENLELKFCTANIHMKEVYDYCKKRGKKIFCISDMYLSSEFILKLLVNSGYDVEKGQIYVSNEYSANKRSGRLFKKFLIEQNILPSSVIHFGDSRYADFIGPSRVGIKAVRIPKYVENCIYPIKTNGNLQLDERTLKAIINNTSAKLSNRNNKIGCDCFSPVVIGYTQWLRKQAYERNIKKYIFLARDGFLFYKVFKEYFESNSIKSEYVYISRNSIRLAYFLAIDNYEDVCVTFPTQKLTVDEILNGIGFDSKEFGDLIQDIGFKANEKFNMREPILNEKVAKLLAKIHNDIPKKYVEKSVFVIDYMKAVGLFENSVAAVDIGWHGSLQVMIEKILQLYGGECIPFFYYGSLSGSSSRLKGYEYHYYALREDNGFDETSLVYFLERFMPEFVGSTKKYEFDSNKGIVIPVLEDKDYSDFKIGKEIQYGCFVCVKNYFDLLGCYADIRGDVSYAPLFSLVSTPKIEDAISIGNIEFTDGIEYSMAKTDSLIDYLRNPSKVVADMKKARWREAFFIRLFKVRLPWTKIFTMMKNIYIKKMKFK